MGYEYYFYFTNGTYIERLSLTYVTNIKKTEKGNIQGKYKVLMLKGSHTQKIVIIK